MQQRVSPTDLSSISSSAYRASQMSERDEDELQRSVGHGYEPVYGGSTSSRGNSQSRGASTSETSGTGSVYAAGESQSQSQRSSQSQRELSDSRKPISTGQYISISARPGSSSVVAVPVRIIQTHGVPDEHQKYYSRTSDYSTGSESSSSRSQNPTSTTYRVVYNPTRNYVSSDKISSTSESESSRTTGGVQQPEKLTTYNSFAPELPSQSQTRFHGGGTETNSESQVRVAPVSVSYPSNGGSSRYASSGSLASQNGQTQSRVVVPVFSSNNIESSSSSRTTEERDQRRYNPSNPTYISSNRNSEQIGSQVLSNSRPTYVISGRTELGSDQQSSSHGSTASHGSMYHVPSASRIHTQAQQQSGSGSQTQYQRQGGYNLFPSRTQPLSSQSSDKLSQRFGSGTFNTNNDDLQPFISESERLAKLQQQQISGSSNGVAISNSEANRRTMQVASNLDSTAANFVRTSNLANRNSELDSSNADASGAGGYNNVRSWNKQSKWSSGIMKTLFLNQFIQ
jgi:hypothetical protein